MLCLMEGKNMKTTNKWQSIVCIVLILTMIIGIWKGPQYLNKWMTSNTNVSENVVQAASASETKEVRAVWISYLDFASAGVSKMSEQKFQNYVNKMFDKCVKLKMNTVIVQVRPFGDAMYRSKYFPWSVVASGKQGRSPGYDPLKCMVKAAHARNLEIHAWINPYRVTLSETKMSSLSSSNPAVKWKKSKLSSTRRNVLSFGGAMYYNPAKASVKDLIVDGVEELVENYDVDGIHMDDYFYPTLGTGYKSNFDAVEYKAYKKNCNKNGKTALGIVQWRRKNVDLLLSEVYASIKKIDKEVVFGVSPAGNINNLYGNDRYYCDVKKWMSKSGYVDYICPQIYWSFSNKICPYTATVKRWCSIKKNAKVDLYIGLAAYRAGISKTEAQAIGDTGWSSGKDILKRQVVAARKQKKVKGFVFFRYENMISSKTKKEVSNLKKVFS